MTDCVLSTRRQLELMQQLQHLADARAAAEGAASEALAAETAAAQQEFETVAADLNRAHSQRRRQLESQFAAAREAAGAKFAADRDAAQRQFAAKRAEVQAQRAEVVRSAEQKRDEACWQAEAVYDAVKDQPRQKLQQARQRINAFSQQIDALERDAHTLMTMRGLAAAAAEAVEQHRRSTAEPASTESSEAALKSAVGELRQCVLDLQAQRTASLFLEGARAWMWFLPAIVVAAAPAVALAGGSPLFAAVGAIVGGAALGGALLAVMRPRGRRQSLDQLNRTLAAIHLARTTKRGALSAAKRLAADQSAANAAQRDADVAAAHAACRSSVGEIDVWQTAELERIEQSADALRQQHEQERDESLAAAHVKYPAEIEANDADRAAAEQENVQVFETRRKAASAAYQAAFDELAEVWHTGFKTIAEELAEMRRTCDELFPDWSVVDWDDWRRPAEPPAAFRFGECRLPLKAVRNGWPENRQLQPALRELALPTLVTLDEQPRLVATATGAGRRAAVDLLQLLMLRFLTAMPAGKLRFTLIDSAGLGESFAAFMHLADHDEQLIGGQIWTDSKQIDRRLTLLSEHMETVLQKYLRNEFAAIHDYNLAAGEVSEPYRLVVVANFPAGFSDAAARKLVSISQRGPRCGVYVLASVDGQLRMPHEFDLAALLADAVHLDWSDDGFVWKYPLFERLPLQIDRLPPRDRLNELLRAAGEESQVASRVEVPFEVVAPAVADVWSQSSADELIAPIGRAGARELQSLRLGKGTSQHVLISGKTGSGKSTLLHALITNLALHYPPDELEFYLIDFKKGVEFRAYAAGRLPHARVIAIESEREFGVSVLERLDEELRRRGELFRRHGVQDLAGIRRAAPEEVVPRTLLIVDEFQELFVSDDKLAQDAALLLDRLVRQGRAFGMHVLLGSQTLSGAYSLARSTLGQMAVRIALECSDADAHLILSDENTAARLLNRPGEAIYNDANGLVEGNHPFQVVWLPDQQRKQYLAQLEERDLAPHQRFDSPIVFEGNVPADPLENAALQSAISDSSGDIAEPTVWLGSAVRIEPPTHVVLRRQGGQNLAIVGGDKSLALGMATSAAVALIGQQQTLDVDVSVFDGSRPESEHRHAWNNFAGALGEAVSLFTPRDASAEIHRLADEVARRCESPDESHAPRYLIIHDLAQFRDLRQTDDEFSFSFSKQDGAPPAVDRRFRELLKEGPAVGVHTLLWCES